MIRILHTADWHLGQTLNGWPREDEHRAALAALTAIAEAQAVDAVIIAGDVFDGMNPSADSMRLLYDTLVALRRVRPHLTTIMVAGNHDAAGRIEAPQPLFAALGVHAVGIIHRRDGAIDLDRHLVPVRDAAGRTGAHVLAIPYPRAADLPGLGESWQHAEPAAGSPVVRAVRRLHDEMIGAARAAIGPAPLVVTGHLNVIGGEADDDSRSAERRILIGGEHAVPHDLYPADLAYVALGHLHKPHAAGRANVRYAGSLFPLSVTERGYRHGVSLVTLGAGPAEITPVPLPRPVAHLRVPEKGALAPAAAEAALAAVAAAQGTPRSLWPFVQAVVAADGPVSGIKADLERAAEPLCLRLVDVSFVRSATAADAGAAPPPPVRLAECDPADLFARAFEATHGVAPGEAHLAAFHHILQRED